jgi:hypothetical protein
MGRPFHNRKRRGGKSKMRLYQPPGKFEGELAIAEILYQLAQDGADEELSNESGTFDALLRGPFDVTEHYLYTMTNRAERRRLKQLAGVGVHEDSNGFVYVAYFDDTESMEEYWATVEEEYAEENEESPTEPEPGDYVTEDYLSWYVYQGTHGTILKLADTENWHKAVQAHMDSEEFWPNAWYRGERGEWNLLDLNKGGYANE